MRRGLLWVLLVLAGGPNVPWGSRAGLRCPLAAVASPLIGIPRRDVFNSAAGDIAGTTAVSGGFQQGNKRELQEATLPDKEEICENQCVTVVRTAAALETAIKAGATNIEIRQHMNLTTLAETFLVPSTVRTIRGNCEAPAPDVELPTSHAPLRPFLPLQCLLLASDNLFQANGTRLWIDRLYIRLTTARHDLFTQLVEARAGRLWMTEMTLQGNGDGVRDCWACGIYSWEGATVYVADSSFLDLDGFNTAVSWKGFGNFVRCTFANNTLHPTEYGAGLIEADTEDEDGGESGMRLEECTFVNNTPTIATIPTFLTDSRAVEENLPSIFSDSSSIQVCNIVGDDPLSEVPPCNNSSPRPLSEAGDGFITATNSWLIQVQKDIIPLPADSAAVDSNEETSSSSNEEGDEVPFIAVASVAGSLLLLAGALFAGILALRRRRSQAESPAAAAVNKDEAVVRQASGLGATSSSKDGSSAQHGSLSLKAAELPSLKAHEMSQSTFSASSTSHNKDVQSSLTGTFGATGTMTKMQDPGPSAGVRAQKAFLDFQLDSLRGKQVLGKLTVLDNVTNRRRGGQAVVQVVEDSKTRIEYAMKFYLSREAFTDERVLYEDPSQPLGQFLPEVHRIVDSGEAGFVDGDGNALPPCIVMERGESLDLWAASTGDGLDMVTGLQVLTHLADRLKDLHAAGYVHRDIKPGNVLWLPRKKRWTLIDFGCVARTGERARTGFTLTYAAPEVIESYKEGGHGVQATEALDAWSVGILAIEIFTGQPVFDVFQSKEDIQDMITGEKPAPWEVESKAPALAKRFGHLKGAILALLNRTPEARPSMAELQYACKRVLSHTTTTPSTILPSAAQPPAIPATAGQAKMENMPPPGPEQAVHSAQPETILIETNETEATLPDDSSGPRRKFSTSTTSTNVADSQTNINAPTTSESDVLPFPTTMNAISEDKPTV